MTLGESDVHSLIIIEFSVIRIEGGKEEEGVRGNEGEKSMGILASELLEVTSQLACCLLQKLLPLYFLTDVTSSYQGFRDKQ